jgi:hypothetical protein
MKANIICDASYDNRTQFCVIAGRILLGDKVMEFTRCYANLKTSTMAEIKAIHACVIEIDNYSKEHNIKFDEIDVGSDCLYGLAYIFPDELKEYSTSNDELVAEGLLISKLLSSISPINKFRHIKAHRKIDVASLEESIHNTIDKMARKGLKLVLDEMALIQRKGDTLFYGISLSDQFIGNDRDAYKDVAYRLAKKGYVARIQFTKNQDISINPFLAGIRSYAEETGTDMDDLIIFNDTNKTGFEDGINSIYCRLYNQLKNNNGKPLADFNFDEKTEVSAVLASRLMLGHIEIENDSAQEMIEKLSNISDFVISEKSKEGRSVFGWVNRITHFVKTPVLQTLNEIVAHVELIEKEIDDRKFYGACLDRFVTNSHIAEYLNFGYKMAKAGYIARIYNANNINELLMEHPLVKGIHRYAWEQKLPKDSFYKIIIQSDKKNKIVNKTYGLDGELMNIFTKETGTQKSWDQESPTAQNSGVATRLLLGEQIRPNSRGFFPMIRKEPKSEFVLANTKITKKGSVSKWLDIFNEYTNIDIYHSMDELMKNKFTSKIDSQKSEAA